MANKGVITRKDIITDEALQFGGEYAKNVKLAIAANKELIQTALQLNDVANAFKSGEGSKAFKQTKELEIKLNNQLIEQYKKKSQLNATLEKEKQAVIATEQKMLRLAKQKESQQNKNNKLSIEERVTLQQKNKEERQSAILTNQLVGAYQKLNLQRTKAKTTLQDYTVQYGKANAKTKQAQVEFDKLDKKVKKADLAVKDFGKNVGNYPNQMGKATSAIKGFIGAFGVVGGIALFAKTFKEAFNISRDFEKQMATLAGVLGKNRAEIQPLTDDAKRLGATTEFTAKQVGSLQEAFARLGFSQEQILDSTEATLKGATALQSDLGETADLVGSTLNQFGLEAKESAKVIDVLAKSTQITALNFKKLQTALPIVGKVAKTAGVSFEETASLLGVLASNGIDASSSASALRNIFIDLASKGITIEEAFEDINSSTNKLSTATELFGKRGATVAVTLAENTGLTEDFTKQLNNAGGSADKLAKEQLNTLDGSLKLLGSAWEGFILSIDEGSGVFGKLARGIIDFGGAVLSALTPSVDKANELSTEFFKQRDQIDNLEKSLTPLVDRHDELANKTELTKDEQKELDSVIQQIAKDVPTAITAFDEYGKALGVNTEVARKFITQQKQILLIKNAEAIDAQTTSLKKVNEEIKLITNTLNGTKGGYQDLIKENGELFRQVVKGGKVTRVELEKVEGGIEKFQLKLQKLQNEKLGREGILAELRGEKTDEQLEAEKAATEKLTVAVSELSDAEKKLAAERAKAIKDSAHKLKIAQLNEEIRVQQDIATDEYATLAERIKAQAAFNDAKIELLKVNRDFELENIAKTSKSKTEADARKAALEIKYQADRANIAHAGNEMYLSILKTGFDKEKEAIAEAKQLKESALKDAIIAENEAFAKTGKSLEDVKTHEKAIADIKKKFALEGVEAQIAEVERLLRMEGFTTEQRAALSEQLKDLKITHSNITTDAIVDDLEEQKKKEEELAALKKQIIADGSKGLADALGIDAANMERFITGIVDGFGEGFEGVLNGIQATAAVVGDVLGSIYDANIQNLEGQLEASDEYYARQTELAGNDQRQKDLLTAEAEKKRQALEKKIAKEKTKKAKADKAMAIVQAGINTALAITSALTQAPPASYVLAALSAAMGIAQIAVIASKPIPKFKDGHLSGTHEGLAITNDGGRAEVWERDGKAQIIQGVNTPIMMKRGDKIHKSVESYEDLMRASILSSVDISNNNLSAYEAKQSFNQNSELLDEIKGLRKDINKKKPTHIHMPKIDIEHEVWKQNNQNW